MESCFYEGVVTHHRYGNPEHQFAYSLCMSYLDLEEITSSSQLRKLLPRSKFAAASFLETDHLHFGKDLLSDLHQLIYTHTGVHCEGPIRLLTQLRYFGYFFSPLNLYYCFDAADTKIEYVVAEVSNTPWNERHHYVLWEGNRTSSNHELLQFEHDKAFHVSPFMEMQLAYRWSLKKPQSQLVVSLENWKQGERVFQATMKLAKVPFTRFHLNRLLFLYPMMSAKTMAAIYWQALKLWWKKCPYYTHPKNQPVSVSNSQK